MRLVLGLLILVLLGCSHRVRLCVISPRGYNCTHPIPKSTAIGIGEYLGMYDPDALIWLESGKKKKGKGTQAIPKDVPEVKHSDGERL